MCATPNAQGTPPVWTGKPQAGRPLEFYLANYTVTDTGCWNWAGKKYVAGYGRAGRFNYAHRLFYTHHVGPIPDGLVIDHLCRNTSCVNPAHLEAVTQAVNVWRGDSVSTKNALKTHCKRGHELTADNVYASILTRYGRRTCKICHRKAVIARKQRRAAERKAARRG